MDILLGLLENYGALFALVIPRHLMVHQISYPTLMLCSFVIFVYIACQYLNHLDREKKFNMVEVYDWHSVVK